MSSRLVGILALQGDFQEHAAAIHRCGSRSLLVKHADDLQNIDSLILPGGESTTMGIIASRDSMIEPLRQYLQTGKPVWGTCAGMILLANQIEGQKNAGQSAIGGLDIAVKRNFFGSQKQSFEIQLSMPVVTDVALEALFIRAPGIIKTGRQVTTLASISHEGKQLPVAVRQQHILATSFHTETTGQNQLHRYFLAMAQG